MEFYGSRNGSQGAETGLEESTRLGLWGRDKYPERPGLADCAYYLRTGLCGYGTKCRYNHPRDRVTVVHTVGGNYPERRGEPVCQFYLKTGTCKFGASCKFHHPRNAGGYLSNIPLSIYGYPLRPDEKECSYYLKTGHCKFGVTCKFHHPQPAEISVPATARPFYPAVQSLSVPSLEQYGGATTSFRVARPPVFPSSYVPGAYSPMLLHPGVIPVPSWSPYSGQVSPTLSANAQSSPGAALYGMSQLASSSPTLNGQPGSYHLLTSSGPASNIRMVKRFPERPGQVECPYYMKTADCKYGSYCRYHHPPDRLGSNANCVLSPLGLPLRPGGQACTFYLQKGHCKFGNACKFDHPFGAT